MAITAAELKVQFSTSGVAKTKADIEGVGNAVDSTNQKSKGFLKGAFETSVGFLGGTLLSNGLGQLKSLGGGFLMANASAEAYRNQLNVAVGDTAKAGEIFDFVKDMAKDTPFEFPELIQGASNLEALGQSATKWLPIIGDTAAATNKSVDQVTQAVLDAQTGEFERLKEFGVRAKVVGDQVEFQFMKNGQMMTVTAENTSEGISNALMGIWSDKYTGAMETMSHTFLGQLSTLKDNINIIAQDMSKPLFDFAKKGLTAANTFIGTYQSLREQGLKPLQAATLAAREAIAQAFGDDVAVKLGSTITSISGWLGQAGAVMGQIGDVASRVAGVLMGALGSAFSFLADHIELVKGAALGLAVAFGGWLAFGAITAIVAGLGAAIAALASPILLVAAAAAALGIAYQTNFLGFADVVDAVVGRVSAAIGALVGYLQAAFSNGFTNGLLKIFSDLSAVAGTLSGVFEPFAGTLKGLGKTFDSVGKVITKVASAISKALKGNWSGAFDDLRGAALGVIDVFRNLSTTANTLVSEVAQILQNGIGRAVDALSDKFGSFASTFQRLGGVLSNGVGILKNVAQAMAALMQGDWSGFFSNLGQAAVDGLQMLGNAFLLIPTLLVDAFHAIDWGALGTGIVDLLSGAISGAGPAFGSAFNAISDMAMEALQAAADWVMSSLQMAWDQIASLDWGDFISDLAWDAFVTLLDWAQWIGGKILDLGAWLIDNVPGIASFAWSTFITAMGNLGDWLIDNVPGIASFAWSTFITAMGNLGDWLKDNVPAIASFAWSGLIQGLGNFGDWLKDNVPAIASFAWSGIISGLGSFGDWLLENVPAIASFAWGGVISGLGNFGDWLLENVPAIASFAWSGIISGLGNFGSWLLENVPKIASFTWGGIIQGMGNFGSWLLTNVPAIASFAWGGVIQGMGNFGTWLLENVPAIASFAWGGIIQGMGNFGSWLLSNVPAISSFDWMGVLGTPISDFASFLEGLIDPFPGWDVPSAQDILNAMFPKPAPNNNNNDGRHDPGEQRDTEQSPGFGTINWGQLGGRLGPSQGGSQTITITFQQVGAEAVAAAAAIAHAAIAAVPTSWTSAIQQTGAEAVSASAVVAHAAIAGIPTAWQTAITEAGGAVVAASAVVAHAAIAAIPKSWSTTITETGGAVVKASANAAMTAIQAIPKSWFTSITESGGATVRSSADAAASAIRGIPTSWHTELSIAGAAAVESAANAAANAIANIPTYHETVIATVGGVARAMGGIINEPFTRLADGGGPELVRLPTGGWMMALRDAIYSMPRGSEVFTAAETARMMGGLVPVPARATGGIVGGGVGLPRYDRYDDRPPVQNFYMVMTRDELDSLFDAADGFNVLTDLSEFRAVMGAR